MTILLSKNECNMKYETNKKKGGGLLSQMKDNGA